MRLLTLPVTVVRVPFELGFGAAKEAVKFAHGLVGGGEEPAAEKPRPATPPRRRTPARRSGNGRSSTGRASTGRAAGRSAAGRPRAKAAASPTTAPVADEPAEAVPAPTPVADRPAEATPAPTATEPTRVYEEPELVAEAAEAGAEDGAGAEVAVDEPWPGYDEMNAPDIEDRLVTEGPEAAAAVSLYEASRKGRASILEAASRSMTG